MEDVEEALEDERLVNKLKKQEGAQLQSHFESQSFMAQMARKRDPHRKAIKRHHMGRCKVEWPGVHVHRQCRCMARRWGWLNIIQGESHLQLFA